MYTEGWEGWHWSSMGLGRSGMCMADLTYTFFPNHTCTCTMLAVFQCGELGFMFVSSTFPLCNN